MLNFKLLRPRNKEEFYQDALAHLFSEQENYKVSIEKTVEITPSDLSKNRNILIQNGITVNSINHYTSNGIQVELNKGTRYDLYIKYKTDCLYNFIVEVKSNLKRVQDGQREAEKDQNQLIRYFVTHVLKFGKVPEIINLIYVSNVDTTKEKQIKNKMRSILEPASTFCSEAKTRISGSVIMLNENLSELTMQAIKDNTFYTNGKTGR